MGLKLWLLDLSAEQAATPTMRSISALKSKKSPGPERGTDVELAGRGGAEVHERVEGAGDV
jgi:hypothetical protein